jgi:hypothetical protein
MIERGLWEWRETEMAKEERSEVTLLFWLLGFLATGSEN